MTELDAFAHAWYVAVLGARGETVEARLGSLITRRSPYRVEALRDAALLVQLPLWNGLALRVHARAASEAPFAGWERSIAPFAFDVTWQQTMDVTSADSSASTELARIAFEDGAWCVVAIFDDAGRTQARQLAQLLAR